MNLTLTDPGAKCLGSVMYNRLVAAEAMFTGYMLLL